ncbi:hypothetical protein THOB06_140126 [Vibrio rotiferianus]|jgi:hypothetical protein|nr:hypothetical protein THOG10_140127 [Vibrio rotiferianus]CAH1565653.1 hypothetical protein THOB06_140126 [Vibrio rotiferianus]
MGNDLHYVALQTAAYKPLSIKHKKTAAQLGRDLFNLTAHSLINE